MTMGKPLIPGASGLLRWWPKLLVVRSRRAPVVAAFIDRTSPVATSSMRGRGGRTRTVDGFRPPVERCGILRT